jgi:hypothetical protein
MSTSGTIVYVHGASDRTDGIEVHVAEIKASLERRGSDLRVVAAEWGPKVGPTLGRVLDAVPTHDGKPRPPGPPAKVRWPWTWWNGLGAAIVAYSHIGDPPRWLELWGTDRVVMRRDALMLGILGVVDALVYQRAGGPIRDFVGRALADAKAEGGPVIALGNSLGGIILVDLLRQPDSPRPDLLVTAGSQSSVMSAIGALDDATEPPPFTPWLNIYDRRDFFAFIAQPVWPDVPGITDHRVDLGKGFPEVHGPAYFMDDQVFDAILGHPALAARSGTSGPAQPGA